MREIPAALVPLDPTVAAVLEVEPGWAWMRCDSCSELHYAHRSGAAPKCKSTPKCKGVMRIYLFLDCQCCGKAVTARRRLADDRFCSKKCQEASA